MEIPGLGRVVADDGLGGYHSEPVPVPVLGGGPCRFEIDGYEEDPHSFDAAIHAFLSIDRSVLTDAAPALFAYYKDVAAEVVDVPAIPGPAQVLDHVELGDHPVVCKDDDGHVYVSVECECAWEPEHGLQIVFRDGARVSKVGPFDGHLTNVAAHADESLAGVIYKGA